MPNKMQESEKQSMLEGFKDLLLMTQGSGIITPDNVRCMVEEMSRKLILEQHPYDIFLSNDGRWRTYVMIEGKRKQIAKSSRAKIEDELVKLYTDKERNNNRTLKTIYEEWFSYKSLHVGAPGTMARIENDWKKYYVGTPIIDIPLRKLTTHQLDVWIHELIKKYGFTKTQYFNMSIIIRQALQYAVEKEYIQTSPFDRVKISKNVLKIPMKKDSKTQVFMTNEQPLVEKSAYEEFESKHNSISLAICLNFQLGLRLGELVALKYGDIKGNYIYIHRMEQKDTIKQSDGTMTPIEYRVVDKAKTDAGIRVIYLTPRAKELLRLIRETNTKNGYSVDEDAFIFVNEKGRIHERAIDYRLRKYCSENNILERGNHKIRKTNISTLIDSGLNTEYIRIRAGHKDERTTLANYHFNRHTDEEIEAEVNKALCG